MAQGRILRREGRKPAGAPQAVPRREPRELGGPRPPAPRRRAPRTGSALPFTGRWGRRRAERREAPAGRGGVGRALRGGQGRG